MCSYFQGKFPHSTPARAEMAKRAAHESAGQAGHEAASRKVLRKASPGPSAAEGASSFGDALQKVLQRKAPRGQGAEVGRSAKGNERLKKRIREEKEAREEKKILIEKRKWFQKEHKIPVRLYCSARC